MANMLLPDGGELNAFIQQSNKLEAKLQKELEDKPEELHPVVVFVDSKFREAADARKTIETKMLASYNLWRGEYSPEENARFQAQQQRNEGASKVFIKVTKTKAQAVYGQILEILFSGSKFPVGVEHTPVPEGSPEIVHLTTRATDATPKTQSVVDYYGYEGDGREIKPGTTRSDLINAVGTKLKSLLGGKTVVSGPTFDKNSELQVYPAASAAEKMDKTMQDQLLETSAHIALRKTVLEMCIFGTGVLKGPFNELQIIDRWENVDGKNVYRPYKRLTPKFEHVSIWNAYPDPEAKTLEDAEYFIERHSFSRSALKALTNRPGFNKEAIEQLLKEGPKASTETFEKEIRDIQVQTTTRYDVREYWGTLSCELARAANIDLEDYEDLLDTVQVCLVVCQGKLLKANLNPFIPTHIPYVMAPYEEHPNQIWGISIPENMSDTQELMNGHMRMAIDNLKLAGNVMLEVDESRMLPNEDFKTYAGKVWRKNGGPPGQSIFGIQFPNTAQSHYYAFDKARQLADEAVGVPSYSHGITGVTGVGRTAAGISMLMGAAALGVKTVISNIDNYMLKPLGEKLFRWNMQFNDVQLEIRGDYKIVARGTSSLMSREVRSQRLLSFGQVTLSNPATAPLVNIKYWLEELAKANDLDSEKIINDIQSAQMLASIIGAAGGMNGQGPGGQAAGANPTEGEGGPGGLMQALGAQDASLPDGGNIGVGSAPVPGERTFSGRTQ